MGNEVASITHPAHCGAAVSTQVYKQETTTSNFHRLFNFSAFFGSIFSNNYTSRTQENYSIREISFLRPNI
jgi:hypothetical protein